MMKSYVPTRASGVLAEQIPSPDDRDTFGAFVGRLIAQGHIRTVQPIDARPAGVGRTGNPTPEVKGGLYFRVAGAKGFTAQPGDWLVLTAEGNLKAQSPEKWEKLGLVADQPEDDTPTEWAADGCPNDDDETPNATADRVLEDSADPKAKRSRLVEPKAD